MADQGCEPGGPVLCTLPPQTPGKSCQLLLILPVKSSLRKGVTPMLSWWCVDQESKAQVA